MRELGSAFRVEVERAYGIGKPEFLCAGARRKPLDDRVSAEEASARLTWALEGLSAAVGVELDPVATSGLVRGALEGA